MRLSLICYVMGGYKKKSTVILTIIIIIYWPGFGVEVWGPALDRKFRLLLEDFPDAGVRMALLTRSTCPLTQGISCDSDLLSSALFFLLTW